uniref:Cytochrome c oxidase subunit 3 n=1 Tax=Nemertopsis sp. WYS-2013 TaxID=1432317 RepID=A0A0A7AE59_9BILA|nr:cytochrome c oxidase subunit III [Nemertopsis sp. WYS-2013]
MTRNPFHLVEFSPWPLVGSVGAFFFYCWFSFLVSCLWCLLFMFSCFGYFSYYVSVVTSCSSSGSFSSFSYWVCFCWIALSNVVVYCFWGSFFFAFFWAYFHSSLAPTLELGGCWPPVGLDFLNPFSVPLLNTAVLLSSGVSVTWAHHSLMEKNRVSGLQGLFVTVFLGVYFTFLQVGEYYDASFSISDSVFGSVFFVATGFHGFHVLVGSTFLMVCLFRVMSYHFSDGHHFGFEAAAWYWHFVDVVWLFLYLCVYWWGS